GARHPVFHLRPGRGHGALRPHRRDEQRPPRDGGRPQGRHRGDDRLGFRRGTQDQKDACVMTTATQTAAAGSLSGGAALLTLMKLRTFIALFAVIIFFSIFAPNFLSTANMILMSKHATQNAFLAIGMTFVIITGGIDLSV